MGLKVFVTQHGRGRSLQTTKRRTSEARCQIALPIMSRRTSKLEIQVPHGVGILLLIVALSLSRRCAYASDFEPYQLNGGLVAAVAGRDFTVIATDTRMMGPGGYELLERNHVASRLWTTASVEPDQTSPTETSLEKITASDGSIQLPPHESMSEPSLVERRAFLQRPPVWIGSAGCSADCEVLKRLVRSDLRAAKYFGECGGSSPSHVATLLSQILYSRRGFPYYSFCVVAGLDHSGEKTDAQVFVYDAIGSYERVAVASAGTGRELLQPILDRQFRTKTSDDNSEENANGDRGDGLFAQVGPSRSLQVSASADEAVSILIDAYRSVSEREIGVGDKIVLCVLQKTKAGCECRSLVSPLKKH